MENLILSTAPYPLVILYQSPASGLDTAAHQFATNEKLLSFATLPHGWHYGQGVPPSHKLISRLIEINNKAYRLGFSRTDAFPGVIGNIMLTLYHGNHLIDLTVEPDLSTATYLYEREGEEVAYHEDIELSTAMKMIEQVGELCRLSEPSTRFITQKLNIDLRVQPLKLLVTEEYPFFPPTVQLNIPEAYVNTLLNITYPSESQVTHQFIGNLKKIYYPPGAIENDE